MAIADAEPKKGEVDVTCTGSSSGSNDMKPRPSLHGLVKYSSLKDFTFSVPDVWDNMNIRIFIECCHTNIEDLKNHNGLEENKVWEKIAKSGLDRGGSITCFNVNYCLELAKCLKSFVSKNEKKMMDNEIFKHLYDDVVDLLPYFAPVNSKRTRSRSKSVESSSVEKMDHPCIQYEPLVYSPFQTHSEHSRAIRVIADILKKYQSEDFMKLSSRSTLWKEVGDCIDQKFGVQVNPKKFLESFKKGVARSVRLHSDPQARAKNFLEQVDAILPFFDLITPHNIKKSEFLDFEKPVALKSCELHEGPGSNDSATETSGPSPKLPKRRKYSFPGLTDNNCPSSNVCSSSSAIEENSVKSRQDEGRKNSVINVEDVNDKATKVTPTTSSECDTSSKESELKPPSTQTDPSTSDVTPKRRGKKRKTDISLVPSRIMPLRLSSINKRIDRTVEILPGPPEKTTQLVPVGTPTSTEIVPISRNFLPSTKKGKIRDHSVFLESPSLVPHNERRHGDIICIPLVETPPVTAESGNDSEIEDVPLMGTNIRWSDIAVRSKTGNRELTSIHKLRGNMNPIVLLDKIPPETLSQTTARRGRRAAQRSIRGKLSALLRTDTDDTKSISDKLNLASQKLLNTPIETPLVRRRGRPPKNPPKAPPSYLTTIVEPPTTTLSQATPSRESPPLVNSSNTDLVRTLAVRNDQAQSSSSFMSRELVSVPHHIFPSSSTALEERNFNPHLASDSNVPPWFEQFVIQTRRHEVWKLHQLMKMQQELLETECKNKNVLDKILAALNR